jgi:A/G-specific adenine glycosylase
LQGKESGEDGLIPDDAKTALIDWYLVNRRDLPWRDTRDPYRILVSEIMLQQTQAERVIPKYHEFLKLFPSIEALADAPASEVIRAWSGLGYNRRALNLQRACQAAIERFGGALPLAVDDLRSLPGVGPYTAGAVACFAYEQDVGFVDTNIRRVLHRMVYGPDVPEMAVSLKEVDDLSRAVVPDGKGYLWNQAIMELGATVCRARATECLLCPVTTWCASRGMMQDAFARTKAAPKSKQIPFEQTSRYFRGRIVHLLRETAQGLTAAELAARIDGEREPGEPPWTLDYLTGLQADGLVVSTQDGVVQEEPPAYDDAPRERVRYRLPD